MNQDEEYANALYRESVRRVSVYPRRNYGSFSASDKVFAAVEARLRYSRIWFSRGESVSGILEDSLLLTLEDSYPFPKGKDFDVVQWYGFVEISIERAEAEVYLWWHEHGIEKHVMPERLQSQANLLLTFSDNEIDPELLNTLN